MLRSSPSKVVYPLYFVYPLFFLLEILIRGWHKFIYQLHCQVSRRKGKPEMLGGKNKQTNKHRMRTCFIFIFDKIQDEKETHRTHLLLLKQQQKRKYSI